MTLQDLGSIGELLAAVATLLTLVYLATQVKHAKTQLKESTQQARTAFTMEVGDRSADVQLAWLSSEGPRTTMTKALLTEEKLEPAEAYEFGVRISIFFGALMQSERLARRGLVDREFLETRYSIYRPYLEMPRVRRWWKRTGTHFWSHDEYAKVIDQLVREIEEKEGQ
jgi:hypothetical protein